MLAGADGSPRRLRVMLADDHATVRQGLRAMLQSLHDVEVVHEVADGEAAIAAVRIVAPDLVVLDLSMPRANGLTVMHRLLAARRQTRIIVLTRYHDEGYVKEAFAAGACGYVLKQSSFVELTRAIDSVRRGQRYLDAVLNKAPTPCKRLTDDGMSLSNRESQVLRRSALGDSNKEISEALEIAIKTVEVHKCRAMRKLGLDSRRKLVRYAALHGWFEDA